MNKDITTVTYFSKYNTRLRPITNTQIARTVMRNKDFDIKINKMFEDAAVVL